MFTHTSSPRSVWLISRRSDFWLACGGAPVAVLAAIGLIILRGDRELDALDFVLSEFHLGATYYTILQRRLWQRLPGDVLLVPLLILALTYALAITGQQILLTSIAMYAAIWHRGRQSLGVARFYQRAAGGALSPAHKYLFQGAVYLPMLAALILYTHLAPLQYEGEPYLSFDLGPEVASITAIAAAAWLVIYFTWTVRSSRTQCLLNTPHPCGMTIHPGEWWAVLAHAIAFGSAYALGASNASFLLVLAVHHEVQYLYFAYAMSRQFAGNFRMSASYLTAFGKSEDAFRSTVAHLTSFLAWPVLGFTGAVAGGWLGLEWLAPLGMAGLFCHYWLDGRIWTRRALAV